MKYWREALFDFLHFYGDLTCLYACISFLLVDLV